MGLRGPAWCHLSGHWSPSRQGGQTLVSGTESPRKEEACLSYLQLTAYTLWAEDMFVDLNTLFMLLVAVSF